MGITTYNEYNVKFKLILLIKIYSTLFYYNIINIFFLKIRPFIKNDYGVASTFNCWIKYYTEESKLRIVILRLVEYYIPLWLAVMYNLFTCFKV